VCGVSDQDKARDLCRRPRIRLVPDPGMGPGMRWVQVRPRASVTPLTLVTCLPTMLAGSVKGPCWRPTPFRATSHTCGQACPDRSDRNSAMGRFVTFDDPDGNGIVR